MLTPAIKKHFFKKGFYYRRIGKITYLIVRLNEYEQTVELHLTSQLTFRHIAWREKKQSVVS